VLQLLVGQFGVPAEEAIDAARVAVLHAGVADLAAACGAQFVVVASLAVDGLALPVHRADVASRGANGRVHD
jgi:hypothetical protein